MHLKRKQNCAGFLPSDGTMNSYVPRTREGKVLRYDGSFFDVMAGSRVGRITVRV